MQISTPRLTILYGSQTGSAQDVAERLRRSAKRLRIPALTRSMDDYLLQSGAELTEEHFAVFVCSTTGQGEEPENMRTFWRRLLRRNLPPNFLGALNCAVLGLGDSSYQRFNFAAKKLNRRLAQLGARLFMELGLADDQHEFGADQVVDPWMREFWAKLKTLWPYPLPSPIEGLLPSKFTVKFCDLDNTGVHRNFQENPVSGPFHSRNPYSAVLLENSRLTPETHFQDTRLIKFRAPFKEVPYDPGDVVVIKPENLDESVKLFMQICPSIDYESSFVLTTNGNEAAANGSDELPDWSVLPQQPCTFEQCLRSYFDLQCVPKRVFFEILSEFADDELEREKLIEFTSTENQEDLISYCVRPRRTVVETLLDFHKTAQRVPVAYWFDLLPSIRPRSFSIASSPNLHTDEIHVLLAVVRYRTKLSRPRLGLCSNWLARLNSGSRVPLWVQKGSFKFPSDRDRVPCIMIGPGTGVAPFRSFVNTRKWRSGSRDDKLNEIIGYSSNEPEKARTRTNDDAWLIQDYLFFGSRNRSADFYFEQEWLDLRSENNEKYTLELFTAFSRDQPEKIYVQHRIEEKGQLIADLILNRQAMVFIAGNAKQMPEDVKNTIKTAIARKNGVNVEELDDFLAQLEKSNRLQTETWS